MKGILYLSFEFVMFINDRQLQMLRDIQQAVNMPQWMLEAEAEEEGWITDDQHAGNAWWNTQFDDVPFGVPGVMPGGRTSHSALPTAEMGTALRRTSVQLNNYEIISLVAIFLIAYVVGYVTDGSVEAGGRVQSPAQLLPTAEIGTAHTTENLVVNHNYHAILANLVENLQSAGQEYTEEQAEAWAWEQFFKQYPEYCELPENYG